MSNEELAKVSTTNGAKEISSDSSVLSESEPSESVEDKVGGQLDKHKSTEEKEPIDWFSVFLIILVLANIGYWLATRNRVVGPDMRVFLASPAEQTFPIADNKKMPSHGMLPPEVKSQANSSSSQAQLEPTQPEQPRLANSAPPQPVSPQALPEPSKQANEVKTISNEGVSLQSVKNEKKQPLVAASDPEGQDSSNDIFSESDSFLVSEELPKAPFAPYFKGKPLEVSTAYKSGVSHEIKRDFLVNQYMYAAEVLDRYRADTKPIFDCDANAQKFSVSGDNEAELRAVQQTIKVSADLLRKTYNHEVAKALAKTKLKGKELEQVKQEAGEAEALLEVSFSRSAEKYEDVLRRLKAQ